ncbi:MAG: hypothetical protein PHD97_11855 [Bacteroidales bacterium]|nr:hypothetical protein [Bacteroidales bacterium]
MTNQNTKALKTFQEMMISRKTTVSRNVLKSLDIDTSNSTQEFGNILLKKDFFGDWSLSIKNDLNDLDGNPISENKKLIQIIKAHYENKKNLKFQELHNLNIWTPKTNIKIGNFVIDSFLSLNSSYTIELIDKNKNVDNLWIDKAINSDRIFSVINLFNISKSELDKMKELDLNKLLEDHFKLYFATVKKGGTSNKGLIDLILGDNVFGIELKLARELKNTGKAFLAIGQIDHYKEEFKNNFMMVIAGSTDEKKEKSVQDLIKKLKETNTSYYYMEAH